MNKKTAGLAQILIGMAMMSGGVFGVTDSLSKYKSTIGCRVQVRDSKENPKINRNEPCNCGSGKKYKKCCIEKTN